MHLEQKEHIKGDKKQYISQNLGRFNYEKVYICYFVFSNYLLSGIFVSAENIECLLLENTYVRLLGKGEIVGNSRCFNWSNSSFEFEFSGSKAEVYANAVKEKLESYNGNCFNVAVYENDTLIRVNRIKLVSDWNTIYEEQSDAPSLKKIMLVRSSEACRGTIRMNKIRTDAVPILKNINSISISHNLLQSGFGINDSAAPVDQATFKTAYAALLDNVRTQYPNTTIFKWSFGNC